MADDPYVPPRRPVGRWLAIGVALTCLLTAGGSMTTTDAVIAYDVTRSIVERGSIALTGDVAGYEPYRGVDGRLYSPFGIGQSIWNIPFYLAGRAAARALGGRAAAGQTIPKAAVALATVPAVAMLAWICFALLTGLGAAPRAAVLTVLLLIFGTSLWPYSGFGFNQPLTALFLWAAVLEASNREQNRFRLALAGVAAGMSFLVRHEMLLAAVLIAGYIALRAKGTAGNRLIWYAAGVLPMFFIWSGLNWWRFGNPLESGYLRDETPGFGGSILNGAAGLLFSPYASLFLYSPIIVLSVFGLRAMWRRERSTTVFFIALFALYFVFYASLGNWMAGRSYGPRYLVPFIPALVLPLAFWNPSSNWRRLAAALALLSVVVQIPGVVVDYSKVRVEKAAAGETVAQDMRWRAMPLLLNVRAAAENTPQAIRFLTGVEPAPQVEIGQKDLSSALSFSLDFWWLYLAYLGLIGRAAAMVVALLLACGSGFAFWRAWKLAG